jgi:hypothetical protein
MAKSKHTAESERPSPDLLAHLELAFGWNEQRALDALGSYLVSTEAGRALQRELAPAGNAAVKAA